ncbi:MAG TPA: nitroreductase family protein [Acidobacteriota bacterium]|nr:nitroreductase family protein [Acidobacteriota bacterium]HQM63989.1 nitroreductase family protein [Acidobacteriota bacterium]
MRLTALFVLLTALAAVPSAQSAPPPAPAAPVPGPAAFLQVFKERRSVRNFRPDAVPREHLLQILDIARTAPTSGNQQPWKFLVIQDRSRLDALAAATVEAYAALYQESKKPTEPELAAFRDKYRQVCARYLSAPVFIVVLTDSKSKYPDYNKWDGPMAAGYLMVAARALGYGTVFCTDSFPFDVVKRVFDIPDRYEVVCTTPLGVPVEWPAAPPKKALEDFVAWERLAE